MLLKKAFNIASQGANMDTCCSDLGEQLLTVDPCPVNPCCVSLHEGEGKGVVVCRETSKTRAYYIDWMRVLAIYLVVLYHCVQALDWVRLWTAPQTLIVHLFRGGALQIGMPLFFHISGRAQAHGTRSKMVTAILSRMKRLLVPFIVGYFLLIPSWTYIHKQGNKNFSYSWLEFQLSYFRPEFFIENFDPAWLWFLPVLFSVSVFCLPVFEFLEVGGIVNFAICFTSWFAVAFGCREYLGLSRIFTILLVLIPGVPAAITCIVPFPPKPENSPRSYIVPLNNARRQWLANTTSSWFHVLLSILLVCNMHYKDLGLVGKFTPGCALYSLFYIQGYCTVRWSANIKDIFDTGVKAQIPEVLRLRSQVRLYELLTVWGVIVMMMTSSPVGEDQKHHMWENTLKNMPYFPIYSADRMHDSTFAALHLLGTWSWLVLCISLSQAYVDEEIHSKVYRHLSGSTIVVYIVHWMFLKVYVFYVVQRYNLVNGWWKLLQLPMAFSVAVGGAYIVYAFCLRFNALGRLFGL